MNIVASGFAADNVSEKVGLSTYADALNKATFGDGLIAHYSLDKAVNRMQA